MRGFSFAVLALGVLALETSTLSAQTPSRLTDEASQWQAAAQLRPARTASGQLESRVQGAALVAPRRSGRSAGQVLMIVGAAGIVTGLIVDEPIITIAGAGVGGYGLYLYLR